MQPGSRPRPALRLSHVPVPLQMEKDETVSDCSPHIANIGRLVEVSGRLPRGLPGSFPPASSSTAPVSGPRLVSSVPSVPSEPGSGPEAPPLLPPEDSAREALSPAPPPQPALGTPPSPCPPEEGVALQSCPGARGRARASPALTAGQALAGGSRAPPCGRRGDCRVPVGQAPPDRAPDWLPPFQDMENKIRSTLNEIYFGKTKDIVNGLR